MEGLALPHHPRFQHHAFAIARLPRDRLLQHGIHIVERHAGQKSQPAQIHGQDGNVAARPSGARRPAACRRRRARSADRKRAGQLFARLYACTEAGMQSAVSLIAESVDAALLAATSAAAGTTLAISVRRGREMIPTDRTRAEVCGMAALSMWFIGRLAKRAHSCETAFYLTRFPPGESWHCLSRHRLSRRAEKTPDCPRRPARGWAARPALQPAALRRRAHALDRALVQRRIAHDAARGRPLRAPAQIAASPESGIRRLRRRRRSQRRQHLGHGDKRQIDGHQRGPLGQVLRLEIAHVHLDRRHARVAAAASRPVGWW